MTLGSWIRTSREALTDEEHEPESGRDCGGSVQRLYYFKRRERWGVAKPRVAWYLAVAIMSATWTGGVRCLASSKDKG